MIQFLVYDYIGYYLPPILSTFLGIFTQKTEHVFPAPTLWTFCFLCYHGSYLGGFEQPTAVQQLAYHHLDFLVRSIIFPLQIIYWIQIPWLVIIFYQRTVIIYFVQDYEAFSCICSSLLDYFHSPLQYEKIHGVERNSLQIRFISKDETIINVNPSNICCISIWRY